MLCSAHALVFLWDTAGEISPFTLTREVEETPVDLQGNYLVEEPQDRKNPNVGFLRTR